MIIENVVINKPYNTKKNQNYPCLIFNNFMHSLPFLFFLFIHSVNVYKIIENYKPNYPFNANNSPPICKS